MGKNNSWLQQGNRYNEISSSSKILDELPLGIYNLLENDFTKELYLELMSDKFEFPFKIYDIDNKFINHVMTTFHGTKGNLGVLLNGTKGTGKTVTAKILVNEMNLPCIIVPSNYKNLQEFLASLEFECILFFDEFEKNFKDHTQDLLSIMDGVYSNPNRKIFLLTTNTLHINDNFLSRPSRIRYKKTFSNLSIDVILNYINDNLVDKTKTIEIIDFINTLAISTIDIVKSIVDEINLHNCGIDDIRDYINVQVASHQYRAVMSDVVKTSEDMKKLYEKNKALIGTKDEDGDIYYSFNETPNTFEETLATEYSIHYIDRGDRCGTRYIVEEKINSDGIIKLKHVHSNQIFFAKIMNTDEKPTLYGNKFSELKLVL